MSRILSVDAVAVPVCNVKYVATVIRRLDTSDALANVSLFFVLEYQKSSCD
jgi:hypothetical protein